MRDNCSGPLVSVVMPVYNTAQYLAEAVDSILAQSYQDFELIAVNDGSRDRSPDILDRYRKLDSRVRVLNHGTNQGIPASRNRGMLDARGKYIAVMDSDDISVRDRLSKQVTFMETHPEVGLCGTQCSFFGDKGKFAGPVPPSDSEEIRCRLLFMPTLSNTSIMMRRDLVVEKQLYYSPDLAAGEDHELSARFARHGRITNIPVVLMRIRTHNSSTTRTSADNPGKYLAMVHRKVLPTLGIEPTQEEYDLHLAVSVGTYGKPGSHVEQVEDWSCRVRDANETNRAYNTQALAPVLFGYWCLVCGLSRESTLWKWKTFTNSPLFVGYRGLFRYCASFDSRRLFRALRRHIAQGYPRR